MKTVLAADLGGTKSRFALVDHDLGVHGASVQPTPKRRGELLALIDAEFARLRRPGTARSDDEEPRALGLGVAGVVRPDCRTLLRTPNLPLAGFDLGTHLEQQHGLPATLINDGRASCWGEYLRGHARARDPLLVLFFGTGIGIGLIAGGSPYGGATNAAGEVGHTVHVPGGRLCPCGNRGCYEAYCGGGPMATRAAEEIAPEPPGGGSWNVAALLAAAADGDARATRIIAEARTAAGAMVASLCTLLNPAAVVLGGGVLRGWPALAADIEDFTRTWCTPPVTETLEFVPSLGESDAILWGAAMATGFLDH
jgi:glucokinase